MADKRECLQISLGTPTPCFTALGSEPCGSRTCQAAAHLDDKGVSYPTTDRMDQLRIDHALHHVCPQTIHNPDLSPDETATLIAGLNSSLNK